MPHKSIIQCFNILYYNYKNIPLQRILCCKAYQVQHLYKDLSPTPLLIFIFITIPMAAICHVLSPVFLLLPRQYHLTSKADLFFIWKAPIVVLTWYKFGMSPHENHPHNRDTLLHTTCHLSFPTSTECGHPRSIWMWCSHISQHGPEEKTRSI